MMSSDQLYNTIGKRVRLRRERLGLTQEQLADHVGLTRTSISNIEQGRQKILVHMLYNLAEALAVAPEALLPLEDTERDERETWEAQIPPGLEPAEQEWVLRVLTRPGEAGNGQDDQRNADPAAR